MRDTDFIVENGLNRPDDVRLFGLNNPILIPNESTMIDVLVIAGIFPSKGQARKNWHGPVEIPGGLSQWVVGKLRNKITILKVKE